MFSLIYLHNNEVSILQLLSKSYLTMEIDIALELYVLSVWNVEVEVK